MGTCSFMALGKEFAGSGQLGNSFQRLFPPVTILHRTQAAGKSMDLDFPHMTGFCTGWWQMGNSLKCIINEISITFAELDYLPKNFDYHGNQLLLVKFKEFTRI